MIVSPMAIIKIIGEADTSIVNYQLSIVHFLYLRQKRKKFLCFVIFY